MVTLALTLTCKTLLVIPVRSCLHGTRSPERSRGSSSGAFSVGELWQKSQKRQRNIVSLAVLLLSDTIQARLIAMALGKVEFIFRLVLNLLLLL